LFEDKRINRTIISIGVIRMKNFDLFDGETETATVNEASFSKYKKFKALYNYRKSEGEKKCGNCLSHIKGMYHNKFYHKCERLGISNSEATDIRVNNVCDLYKEIDL
jgi:hypothetical protein